MKITRIFPLVLMVCGLLMPGLGRAASSPSPNGLYLMTRFSFGSYNIEVWFFSKGKFAKTPKFVGKTLDFAGAEAQSPGTTGTFSISGDKMTLVGPAFKATESRLEPGAGAGGCFYWNAGLYCPATSFGSGDALSGTFSGSIGSGGASSAMTVKFTPDGKYEMSRSGSVQIPGAYAGSSGSSRGRYELEGNVMRLTPETGGAAMLMTTLPYDDGSKGLQPRRLYLGGFMLKRTG